MPKRNRQQARKARKRGLMWCDYCDKSLVGLGAQCSFCGRRNGRKRDKKPAPSVEEYF